MRLLALCWAGFVMVFFTFSTTQEYYSMPCYPALGAAARMRDRPRAALEPRVAAVVAVDLAALAIVRDPVSRSGVCRRRAISRRH